MFLGFSTEIDRAVYPMRRKDLIERIREQFSVPNQSALLLIADYEQDYSLFRQESSFFYLTGIREPAVAMLILFDGGTTLFLPYFGHDRATWVEDLLTSIKNESESYGIDFIKQLGDQVSGYKMELWEPKQSYAILIEQVQKIVVAGGNIFTLAPDTASGYPQQRLVLDRMNKWVDRLHESMIDVSVHVAKMRRHKDMAEIETIYKAVEITALAHQAAAQVIGHEMLECEVQGQAEFMITGSGAQSAFPSVVASGPQATILHYMANCRTMEKGELVLVDCGAMFNHYCGDISRTFPVSGTFTQRQLELYNIVLETQEYIADIVMPGFWLSNPQQPEKSINHLARAFLKKKGYEQYLVHGVSHFLGLDVHDVGDIADPLEEGDIITIEPGIYIPNEKIGIRIEDDYWVTKAGLICLSESLPKKPDEIEMMMQEVEACLEESLCDDESECTCEFDDDLLGD